MIKFVEYTGRFPNLCSGILVLDVNGKEYIFNGKRKNGKLVRFDLYGSEYRDGKGDFTTEGYLKPGLYDEFWHSGGCVSFDNNWTEHVESGKWEICKDELPDELKPFAQEIDDLFNANVPWGCCGGCV